MRSAEPASGFLHHRQKRGDVSKLASDVFLERLGHRILESPLVDVPLPRTYVFTDFPLSWATTYLPLSCAWTHSILYGPDGNATGLCST